MPTGRRRFAGSEPRAPRFTTANPKSRRSTELTVVIPVRNNWAGVGACLATIASQELLPTHVVVVDDGSDVPASSAIVSESRPFRLRVIRQSHLGVSAARNTGFHASETPLVLFVDSDVLLEPA